MRMQYELENTENADATEIERLIKAGAKFRVFQYRIALIAVAFPRLSPAILIRNKEEFIKQKRKYNLISIFCGLWFFPTGPWRVYNAIQFNKEGGIDATGDILLNLQHYDKENKCIAIEKMYTVFDKISKADLKELSAALSVFISTHTNIKKIYVARYVDLGVEPPYFIGLDTEESRNAFDEEMRGLIYKRFMHFVEFRIFTKADEPELFEKITGQGQELITKQSK